MLFNSLGFAVFLVLVFKIKGLRMGLLTITISVLISLVVPDIVSLIGMFVILVHFVLVFFSLTFSISAIAMAQTHLVLSLK